MKKIIEKYGECDYKITEEKTETVISTANIKVLEKEIENLEIEIIEKGTKLTEKKDLLKELKAVK